MHAWPLVCVCCFCRRAVLGATLGWLLAGWVWAAPPQATRASGLVRYVADGDTVYVRLAGKFEQQAVRLVGIDAPEICQDGGVAARDALQALLQDRIVELHIQGQDDYGRMLARVFLDGADVGRSMVMQGWAWSYRLGRDADPYSVEQQAARDAQLGLFAQPSPEPPARFRRRHGRCRATP